MAQYEYKVLWLVLVLRGTAVLLLLAFVGAALPESWMKAVYEWGGLGPWPGGALLVYLARAVSVVYGFYGLLALYLSFDVLRYRAAKPGAFCCAIRRHTLAARG